MGPGRTSSRTKKDRNLYRHSMSFTQRLKTYLVSERKDLQTGHPIDICETGDKARIVGRDAFIVSK